jgi:hypothetical protein
MAGFLPGPYGPPLVCRSISEWQQLALSGELHPEHQLYDPVRAVWLRACDHPELRPYFPVPQVNWGALLGLGALATLAIAASGSAATETRRGPDTSWRPERGTRKKRVFVSFDFDNNKVLKDFVIGQARNPDSPFEVIDTSLKEAAPMKTWEDKSEVRPGCNRFAVLLPLHPETPRKPVKSHGAQKRVLTVDRPTGKVGGVALVPV